MTPENFHHAIHAAVGAHTQHYETVRRGKQTYRRRVASNHMSNWSSAVVNIAAKRIIINVYLNMKQNDLSNTVYQRLKLMAQMGIGHYWSRGVSINCQQYAVQVVAQQREGNAIGADLRYHQMEDNDDYSRSFNLGSPSIDASFVYNERPNPKNLSPNPRQTAADQDFRLTSAHEFGHSVLMYFGGAGMSWGHKGSTHIVPQSIKSSTPGYPATGQIDMMKHFDANKRGISSQDRARRSKATEQDVMRLVWLSTITF